jgi:hypothetical protein
MKLFSWVIAFFLPSLLSGQEQIRLSGQLPYEVSWAGTDQLGFHYIITHKEEVLKLGSDGRVLSQYAQTRFGKPQWMDLSNPLKVLLWFDDFKTIVWLNRSLTPVGETNLIDAGLPEVRTLAAARDGNIWLYDEPAFKLRKINPSGQALLESTALNAFLDSTPVITCIRETDSGVWAATQSHGLLRFDIFGQFQQRFPITDSIQTFVCIGPYIAYIQEGKIKFVIIQQGIEKTIPLPEVHKSAANWLSTVGWIVQKGKNIDLYQIE